MIIYVRSLRPTSRGATLVPAFLAAAATLGAPSDSRAQQEFLCADPRGFCSALIRPVCLERIEQETLTTEEDPECGGALLAYRACLSDAVGCPEVVDPVTPTAQADAQAPCVDPGCEVAPPIPVVRDPPPDRAAQPDQQAEETLDAPG